MKENPKRSLNKCKFKKNVDPKLNNLSSKNKMLFGDEWLGLVTSQATRARLGLSSKKARLGLSS